MSSGSNLVVTETMERCCQWATTALELAESEILPRYAGAGDSSSPSSLEKLVGDQMPTPTTPSTPVPDGEEIKERPQRTTNAQHESGDAGIEVQHSALRGKVATVTGPEGENVVVRAFSIDTTMPPPPPPLDGESRSRSRSTLSPIYKKEDLYENVTYQTKKNGVPKKIFKALGKIRK